MSNNFDKDYKYFSSLWEDAKPQNGIDQMTQWNERAESWEKLLEFDSAFKRSLEDRVTKASAFLRERGLLKTGSAVADIGCGTGRFTTEFAKTAGHVTGIDISENMLKLARRHACENEVKNTSYFLRDFSEADIEAEGWEGAFDLVFSSITAAAASMDNLMKMMKMSRAYCFNSSFIHNSDELEKQVARELFSIELKPRHAAEGRSFYSLFNLLWLDGFYPETCYHKQYHDNMVPVDDELADYLTRSIFRNTEISDGIAPRIKSYLLKNADSNGRIKQYTERWYGWILWDVRDNDGRR